MSYRAQLSRAMLAFVFLVAFGVPGVGQDADLWFTPEPASVTGTDGTGHQFGDPNCDGRLDFNDLNPFVLALIDPAAYQAQFPNCNILECDFNCDNVVNFDDINAMISWAFCITCGPGPWYCP